MQVPVYRCSLADKMVTRLRPIPGGLWLADKIEAQPLEDHARLICGPDLNAISATTCVPDRCHRRCRAAFNPVLTDLGLSGELIDD